MSISCCALSFCFAENHALRQGFPSNPTREVSTHCSGEPFDMKPDNFHAVALGMGLDVIANYYFAELIEEVSRSADPPQNRHDG